VTASVPAVAGVPSPGASAHGALVPVRGRLNLELACSFGLFAQGGYSYAVLGDVPNTTSFGLGLTYRMAVVCN
jgi:hypothetical protein